MSVLPSARAALFLLLVATTSCGLLTPGPPPAPTDTDRLTALLVNGGGTTGSNYWSHLHHLREMQRLLLDAGVARDRIWVLASDGDDPAADLAQRRPHPHEDDWILGGDLDRLLGAKTEHVSSRIEDVRLGRADRAGVEDWFARVGSALGAGDTLLLFVTDHGTQNEKDPADNRITLWGPDQAISVRELRAVIDRHLPPEVRVVTIMSQCYSGSFAHLADLDPSVEATRATCGYFSTTASRRAYGCYPEVAEREDRGHAIRMAEALTRLGALPAAHEAVAVWDDTPDVPLRTSDVFLERALAAAAERDGRPLSALADEEIARALADPKRWEPELRLLDDVAAHYGLFSPRRLAELDERSLALTRLAEGFGRHRSAWTAAHASAADANVGRWLSVAGDPWRERLTPRAVHELDADGRAELRSAVLTDLGDHTRADGDTFSRLGRLHEMADRAQGVTYRMDVRLGVLLRMRHILLRIAGQSFLERAGTPAERRRLGDLVACETLRLAPSPASRTEVPPPEPPLPAFAEDEELARTFLPSWLGVKFQRPPAALAESGELPDGAAFVGAVFEQSAAAAAGIRAGDVILGPPGRPFREPEQLREWTMLHSRGTPAPLRLLRGGAPVDVTVRLQPFPTDFPSLPAPPSTGDVAPALSLSPYRGAPPRSLATGRKTLLFFWATWCGFCKAALPELEDLARRHGLDVVAISDESTRLHDGFFASHAGYFPPTVALDPVRATFLAYGVNGMPTFVLVGPDGRIDGHHVGYDRKKGLPF